MDYSPCSPCLPIRNAQCPIPNTSLREAAPTTSLLRRRSVQVPNALFANFI
ncbi:MAG: hypothetical protein V7K14_14705 [Nostoc sp.]|uniref:hypothetical protein n=1 Tax=uncultured Nostoc sp. TaxID=340711 RepID=UPI0035CAD59E|nr:hypothetical protein [Nostoc sp. NMS7]